INALLLRLWAFAHCFLCGAPYTWKRGDLSPYALLGRFLPRLRPLLGAASFFDSPPCNVRKRTKKGGKAFFVRPSLTFYVCNTDPFSAKGLQGSPASQSTAYAVPHPRDDGRVATNFPSPAKYRTRSLSARRKRLHEAPSEFRPVRFHANIGVAAIRRGPATVGDGLAARQGAGEFDVD